MGDKINLFMYAKYSSLLAYVFPTLLLALLKVFKKVFFFFMHYESNKEGGKAIQPQTQRAILARNSP